VNIEEKLEDSNYESTKPKKRMTDAEIKELRRRQQEKALKAQEAINQELKRNHETLHSIREDENEQEPGENASKEEAKRAPVEKVTDLNFMDKLKDQIESLEINDGDVQFDQEAENDLSNMIKDFDKNINRENNRNVEKLLRENAEKLKTRKQVKWSDDSHESMEIIAPATNQDEDEDDDDYDDEDEEEELDSDDYDKINEDEVRPAETASKKAPESMVIKIRHTKSETLNEIDRRNRLSRDKPVLDNPGDIFTTFYQPKSILKNKDDLVLVDDEKLKARRPVSTEPKAPKNVLNEKFEPEKVSDDFVDFRKFIKFKIVKCVLILRRRSVVISLRDRPRP
jgi:hypothetical protein